MSDLIFQAHLVCLVRNMFRNQIVPEYVHLDTLRQQAKGQQTRE